MKISIIIVSRDERADVRRCVGSLWQHCRGLPPEVIVVDNGSRDGCAEMLAEEFPSVKVVKSREILSLTTANNLGASHATGDSLMFLQPETELIEDSVAFFLRWMNERPEAGAAGCALLNPDRTIVTESVRAFPTITNQVLDSEYLRERFPDSRLWGQRALHAKWPRQAAVEEVSGACLVVRRTCFLKVGGCNEAFSSFGWEADLCYRLRQSGAVVYYVPETSMLYRGRIAADPLQSASNIVVRDSIYRFMAAHYGSSYAAGYRLAMGVTAATRLMLIPPMMPLGRTLVRHGRGSWKKWTTILRWSLGW